MSNSRSIVLALTVVCCSQAAPAFAQADTGHYTAGSGAQGMVFDNDPTSDVTMTENNNQDDYYIAPPSNTTTSTTEQHNYQGITNNIPTRTGLLAPVSTVQFGDTRSFKWVYDLGFPPPKGVTGPGVRDPQGQNWSPGGNIYLPDTGTPSVSLNVTIDGGY